MTDRNGAAGTVTAMLHAVDILHWETARATLADEVTTDYTSLFGGAVETVPAAEVIRRWQGLLPGFDATQHLTGPVLVSGDGGPEATCVTDLRAYHLLVDGDDRRTWTLVGRYRMRLRQEFGAGAPDGAFKITAITLDAFYQEGDRTLAEQAGRRAGSGSGGRASRAGAAMPG